MRIAFLCSSLEPGRDGVGDYSTLLARECTRQGHPTALIALNDRHNPQTVEGVLSASEPADAVEIPFLRLPSSEDWGTRTTKAIAFLREFAPDWISLQFVCYGFQDKGIVAKQVPHLGALSQAIPQARTHVMLHELWIGDTNEWSLRQRIVGLIQTHFVLSLLRAWAPKVMHTSNEGYSQRMAAVGFKQVKVLPLFSNIPVKDTLGDAWLLPQLQVVDKDSQFVHSRDEYLLCGLFGGLPPQWQPEPLLSYLLDAGDRMGKKIVLLSAGRMGEKGQMLWKQIQSRYSDRMLLLDLGELPAERISEYLNSIDIGIAATDTRKIGKSSAAATMLAHGLPVLINQTNDSLLQCWDDRSRMLLYVVDSNLSNLVVAGLPRLSPASGLAETARRFLLSLQYV